MTVGVTGEGGTVVTTGEGDTEGDGRAEGEAWQAARSRAAATAYRRMCIREARFGSLASSTDFA